MEAILCQHSLLCRDIFEWIIENQQPFLIKVSGTTAIVLFLLSSSIMEFLLTMSGYIIFSLLIFRIQSLFLII